MGFAGTAIVELLRGRREKDAKRMEWRREVYAEYLAAVDLILRAKLSGGLVGQAMSNVAAGLTGSRMDPAVFELAQALSRLELVCSEWVSPPAEAVFEAARAVALATRILGPTCEEILVLRRATERLVKAMRTDVNA